MRDAFSTDRFFRSIRCGAQILAASSTTDRRFLSADERGSIISVTNSSGTLLGINRYDEYGQPQGTNLGVWGYTGQTWLPNLNVWYYKARMYESEAGRFLQTDPIGYAGGTNLYAYVGNSPVSFTDPFGLQEASIDDRVWTESWPDMPRLNPFGERAGFAPIFGTMPLGRYDAIRLEWAQSALARMSRETGVSQACLLSCPLGAVYALAAAIDNSSVPANVRDVLKHANVQSAVADAWVRSQPNAQASKKNEHGFWLTPVGKVIVSDRY